MLISFAEDKTNVRSGVRTRASEENSALSCRLRPLGHPNMYDTCHLMRCTSIKNLTGRNRTTGLGITAELLLQSPALPTELP